MPFARVFEQLLRNHWDATQLFSPDNKETVSVEIHDCLYPDVA